jgi:hypothetical protein
MTDIKITQHADVLDSQISADLLEAKEIALASFLSDEKHSIELSNILDSLPEENEVSDRLKKDLLGCIKEARTLEEKKTIMEPKSSGIGALLNKALSFMSPENKPTTNLITKQQQINKSVLEATCELQRRKHGLQLSNAAFHRHLETSGYDVEAINNAISRGKADSSPHLDRLFKDQDAITLMNDQTEKAKAFSTIMQSEQTQTMINNLKSGAIGGKLKQRIEDEINDLSAATENLEKTPTISEGKFTEIGKSVRESIDKFLESLSGIFNRASKSPGMKM